MSKTVRVLFIIMIFCALFLSACASKGDLPAAAVEAYWKAMADKDSAALGSLSCADYEATAVSTLDSFLAVDLELKDLSCASVNTSGKTADVTCKGSLTASYGSENFDFELSNKTFVATQTGSDWLFCGEK